MSCKKQLFWIIIIIVFASCSNDDDLNNLDSQLESILNRQSPTGDIDYFRMPQSDDFDNIPQDPKNLLTKEKVELGKLLFHETGLALAPMKEISKGSYSCASCHFASAGFQAGRWQGIGEGGIGVGLNGEGRIPLLEKYEGNELDVQPTRSPTAMNGAWQELMLWNGQFGATGANKGTEDLWINETPLEINNLGFHGLETQAIAGLKVHRMEINPTIIDTLGYKEIYDVVFWNIPIDERYTKVTTGLAIAAFERTLLSNQAPFQLWLEGQATLSEKELKGALLFFDESKGNCSSCHTGPALNSMDFYAIGLNDLYQVNEAVFNASEFGNEVLGRGGFTKRQSDMYKFKVPQLYNLKDSPFYGHGSSLRSLDDVLAYKNEAIPQKVSIPPSQLAQEFVPLNLTPTEMDDLKSFLINSLNDQELNRYVPVELPSGQCTPFNDLLSQAHLGCN